VIDIHSHLIPGVDDGARTVADALTAAARFSEAGVTRVLTTPHLDGSLTERPSVLGSRLDQLDAAWAALLDARETWDAELPELLRGTEVKLDTPTSELGDARVRMAGTRFVLVEFPFLSIPPRSAAALERIRSQGWIPVLAHPERYDGGRASLEAMLEWRRAGAYLQVNCSALFGRYGDEARRAAWRLLERGAVDYLASDYHCYGDVPNRECARMLDEGGGDEQLDLMLRVNPGRLIDDELPLPVPPLASRPGFWRRLADGWKGAHR
jgi:protein-tyrosine phosphatase